LTQEERCGTRDRAYSAWHRRYSIGRFVGRENAHLLAMIDLDTIPYVEYEDKTKKPLAVIETAIDIGQTFKTATVTSNLAKLAGLPCFVVLLSGKLEEIKKTLYFVFCINKQTK